MAGILKAFRRRSSSHAEPSTVELSTTSEVVADDPSVRDIDATRFANSDSEIRTAKDDTLGRSGFSETVAARIMLAGSGPSTVFGLAGPWGTGKTSTLNMITNFIRDQESGGDSASKTWFVATFAPWACQDIDALTSEFYSAIAAALPNSETGKNLRRLLSRSAPVTKAIAKAAASSFIDKHIGDKGAQKIFDAGADAFLDSAADFSSKQPPFTERFNAISKAIRESGYQIVVVIDDLDRLHSDELLAVLKAVRLLGRFDHVHYLLSYDEETLIDVLVNTDIARGERGRARQYLEKIIQYPFALPPIQGVQVEVHVREGLADVGRRLGYEIDSVDSDVWKSSVDRIVRSIPDLSALTLRGVRRWCNQIEILAALIGNGEFDFADAAMVTFVRLNYADVYRHLVRWESDLTTSGAAFVAMGTSNREISKEQWEIRIAEALGEKAGSTRISDAIYVAGCIFPRLAGRSYGSVPKYSVQAPEYFDRYFVLGIPVGDVRDMVVREELRQLAYSGKLDSDSVLAPVTQGEGLTFRVFKKALAQLDVISESPSDSALQGSIALVRAFDEDARVFSNVASLAYCLLGQAVSSAFAEGGRVIDMFCEEVGVVAAADVLARRKVMASPHDVAIDSASANFRLKVYEACVNDLTVEVGEDDPSIIRISDYLDDELWGKLRAAAQALLSEGVCDLADVAARFTTISKRAHTGKVEAELHTELFEQVIPREDWPNYDIPGSLEDPVDLADSTLRNRKDFAARTLHGAVRYERPNDGEGSGG